MAGLFLFAAWVITPQWEYPLTSGAMQNHEDVPIIPRQSLDLDVGLIRMHRMEDSVCLGADVNGLFLEGLGKDHEKPPGLPP